MLKGQEFKLEFDVYEGQRESVILCLINSIVRDHLHIEMTRSYLASCLETYPRVRLIPY